MNKELFKQIIKFVIVGGIATAIDFGILYLLDDIAGMNPVLAKAISFSLSLIVNYLLSMKFVFNPDERLSKQKQFLIFAITSLIGLGLSVLIMWAGTQIFGDKTLTVLLINIFSTALIMVYNYVSKKLLLEPRKKKMAQNEQEVSQEEKEEKE